MTLVNGFLTFVLPLTNGDFRDPVYPAYVFFATIETVCTSVIIWQAWTWSGIEAGSYGTQAAVRFLRRPDSRVSLNWLRRHRVPPHQVSELILVPLGQSEKAMGRESPIESWLAPDNRHACCFRMNWLRS